LHRLPITYMLMLMKQNQKGFSAVTAVLAVLVVAGIGLAGWQVAKRSQQPARQASSTPPVSVTDNAVTVKQDADSSLPVYTSAKGKYTLRYPAEWLLAANLENCADGLVLLGPTADTVGKCGSSFMGQMAVLSTDGDIREEYVSPSPNAMNASETVTVDGVKGTKYSRTVNDKEAASAGPGSTPAGTKIVVYVFYANGRTYAATYMGKPTYPDVLSDFNKMIMTNLHFSVD
jgi:hypothetical protein